MKTSLLPLLIFLALAAAGPAGGSDMTDSAALVDFTYPDRAWFPVNDGVMGGLSSSRVSYSDQGTAIFSGELSLENNGGFASVRTVLTRQDCADFSGVQFRVKGDGRTYQLRFRTDERFDGAAYRALFATEADRWTTVRLDFSEFEPTFRGRILDGYGPLDTSSLRQLTLMLADKKAGPFRLEIGSIRLVADEQP